MTKRVSLYGILCALALILSFVESQIPTFFAVPGMKLGLTNIVVVIALYLLGPKPALFINVVRIILVSVLFGNSVSLIYSLAGGILSYVIMFLLWKTKRFHTVTVSIAGGVFHNVGQIIVAMLVLNTNAMIWYLPVLWIGGIVSGALIGIAGAGVLKRIPKSNL